MTTFLAEDDIKQLVAAHGTPLLILDCNQLKIQLSLLNDALPGVDFFYAVKAFPHPAIINTLYQCGVSFDLASSGEVEMARSLYIDPRRTIHTHPIKKNRDIRDALRFGCTTFVADNLEEFKKYHQFRHRVGLFLRVSFRSEDAVIDLSRKFGCAPDETLDLLQQANDMGLHVKGLSFHVGSQSKTSAAHVHAIEQCINIMDQYSNVSETPLSTLDIGGGFPVSYDGSKCDIVEFCKPIRQALDKASKDIHIIAEPGRFLAAPAAISITSVVGKAERNKHIWYYLDDGVYGAYSGKIFDHMTYPVRSLKKGTARPCTLAGPTCDSIDVIAENILLPDLEIGDLVVGEVMGAYTCATATDFNSLPRSQIIVLNEAASDRTIYHIA